MSAPDPGPVPPAQTDQADASVGATASASARRIIVARAGSLAIVFLGSIVLARTLGPDDRGAQAFFVALTIMSAGILGLGAATGGYILSSRHDVPPGHLAANAAWLAVSAGVIAAGATLALEALTGFLPAALAAVPVWPLLVGLGVAGLVVNNHQLQLAFGTGRPAAGALLSFGPYTLAAVGYLAMPVIRGGLQFSMTVFALAPYVLAVGAALIRPRLSVVAFGRPRLSLARRSIREGLRTYPGELAGMLHSRADVLLLGILAPAATLGIYVVAYQSVEPILILASASGATILALGHGRAAVEGGAVTARLIRETLIAGGLLAILAAILAPFLVPLVYGPAFADAVGPLLILLPGIVALSIGRIAMADLLRRNLLEQTAAISITVMVINVVLNLLLIPGLGAIGAATASLVSYTIHAVLAVTADRQAGGFTLGALVPRRADVTDLARAWMPGRMRVGKP
jgi:O-antigen/teichoic acid export membrane protein